MITHVYNNVLSHLHLLYTSTPTGTHARFGYHGTHEPKHGLLMCTLCQQTVHNFVCFDFASVKSRAQSEIVCPNWGSPPKHNPAGDTSCAKKAIRAAGRVRCFPLQSVYNLASDIKRLGVPWWKDQPTCTFCKVILALGHVLSPQTTSIHHEMLP